MAAKPEPKVIHLEGVPLDEYIALSEREIKRVVANNDKLALCYISIHTSHLDKVTDALHKSKVFEGHSISVKCRVARQTLEDIRGRTNVFISIDARMVLEHLREETYKTSLRTLASMSLRGNQTTFIWNGPKPKGA